METDKESEHRKNGKPIEEEDEYEAMYRNRGEEKNSGGINLKGRRFSKAPGKIIGEMSCSLCKQTQWRTIYKLQCSGYFSVFTCKI